MFRTADTQKQRGSVEVVILVVVVAAVIGLVAWRIAETQKTQIDTQAAIDNDGTIARPDNIVDAASLGIRLTVPAGSGKVTTANAQGGDTPSVELISEKLKAAEYTCDGDNSGAFGMLGVAAAGNGPQPQFVKELGGTTYGFTNGLTKNCYSAELLRDFRETVPKAVVESIVAIPGQKDAAITEK